MNHFSPQLICLAAAVGVAVASGCSRTDPTKAHQPFPTGTLTYSKHIAPILFTHCANCHRPGQAGPFSLLEYSQAKKHAKQIAEVTESRYMPPWLPVAPSFIGERRLTDREIGMIRQWTAEGAVEGNPADLPPLPTFSEGWALGEPDQVVTMPEPYTLPPDGKDTYRNFVIPVSISQRRFVKAVDIKPANPAVVHHAVMQVDRTPASRQLDVQDPEVGFGGGMAFGRARLPDGHFIGWTPGKFPTRPTDGMAWTLDPGTDLVVQLHMRPTGKPEPVQMLIGLYFSIRPPTRHAFAFVLRSKSIDIAAGSKDYIVEKSEVLPVPVNVLRIYPHAHYLATEMKVWATLPTGQIKPLLQIDQWDFNWQDEYQYPTPIPLPAGATITMRYKFDNSADNPRNPNHPPKRVVYGQNSTDEMAELLLQLSPNTTEDLTQLQQQSMYRAVVEEIERCVQHLTQNPDDASEHQKLAMYYRQIGQYEEAAKHFRETLRIDGNTVQAHYWLGNTLAEADLLDQALPHFRAAYRLQPNQPEILNALAQALARKLNPDADSRAEAIQLATRAVELTGRKDPMILETLSVAFAAAGQLDRARESAAEAIQAATVANQPELAEQIRRRTQELSR